MRGSPLSFVYNPHFKYMHLFQARYFSVIIYLFRDYTYFLRTYDQRPIYVLQRVECWGVRWVSCVEKLNPEFQVLIVYDLFTIHAIGAHIQ